MKDDRKMIDSDMIEESIRESGNSMEFISAIMERMDMLVE